MHRRKRKCNQSDHLAPVTPDGQVTIQYNRPTPGPPPFFSELGDRTSESTVQSMRSLRPGAATVQRWCSTTTYGEDVDPRSLGLVLPTVRKTHAAMYAMRVVQIVEVR
ncbi:hypothetical protein BDP55DRAFT_405417 [Colletotrichum godetiae]|uniref:Uncharacterized protein n=1 Tax=Colletotrichum godetiae TaxID=1209918 RepID=A0AAJ0A8Q2_9PEZI|nr:uncharacterized protein BDP55DRAFT_405417 [Colletotrichum godetiae]KAK1658094.1 hypothetical protein BDP55DRAFT_405417 [Colletotrichum godetiae]